MTFLDFNQNWNVEINFSKNPKYVFSQKSFPESCAVPCGQTDIHDEVNSRFPQLLRERA
jgi:hypothetical protein